MTPLKQLKLLLKSIEHLSRNKTSATKSFSLKSSFYNYPTFILSFGTGYIRLIDFMVNTVYILFLAVLLLKYIILG